MWRSSRAPLAAVAAWLLIAACSESPDRPPELGKCVVDGASCPAAIAAGGVQGGEDAGVATPSSCQVNAGDSQCTQCANSSCCSSYAACVENTDCQNLLNCEQACTGALDCVSTCESQSPRGVAPLETLTTCIQSKCPVCSQLGVGDPCSPLGAACNPGLTCSGLWCTKGCTRSSDCVGLGASGGNELGFPNACIVTSAAREACQPGCTQDADCSAFPGAFCFATTSSEGLSVRVCMPPPDAGSD